RRLERAAALDGRHLFARRFARRGPRIRSGPGIPVGPDAVIHAPSARRSRRRPGLLVTRTDKLFERLGALHTLKHDPPSSGDVTLPDTDEGAMFGTAGCGGGVVAADDHAEIVRRCCFDFLHEVGHARPGGGDRDGFLTRGDGDSALPVKAYA